jgi:hypothetical protein
MKVEVKKYRSTHAYEKDSAKRLSSGWIQESPDARPKKFSLLTGFLANKGITWVKDGVVVRPHLAEAR